MWLQSCCAIVPDCPGNWVQISSQVDPLRMLVFGRPDPRRLSQRNRLLVRETAAVGSGLARGSNLRNQRRADATGAEGELFLAL